MKRLSYWTAGILLILAVLLFFVLHNWGDTARSGDESGADEPVRTSPEKSELIGANTAAQDVLITQAENAPFLTGKADVGGRTYRFAYRRYPSPITIPPDYQCELVADVSPLRTELSLRSAYHHVALEECSKLCVDPEYWKSDQLETLKSLGMTWPEFQRWDRQRNYTVRVIGEIRIADLALVVSTITFPDNDKVYYESTCIRKKDGCYQHDPESKESNELLRGFSADRYSVLRESAE